MTKELNDDGAKLIIDWSVISYKNWHKMANPNYEPETGREDTEFSINMYLFTLFLVEALQPSEIVFALDSRPNWREDVYKDYYLEHLKLAQKFSIVEPENRSEKGTIRKYEKEYIAEFDQKTIRYWYSEEAQKWMLKKLNKSDVAKVEWDSYKPVALDDEEIREKLELDKDEDVREYMKQGSKIRKVIDDLNLEKKRDVLYNTLKGLSPAYKGHRSSANWDYATPKNGYLDENKKFIPGFRELADGIAVSLAGTFGAKVVKAKDAEADDVIAHYVKTDKSGKDIILVSVDSDLHQLYLDSLFFKYWNPNIDEEGKPSHFGSFVDLNKTTVKFNLRKKLLSGDSSDNIPGCMQIDQKNGGWKSTLVGDKTAEKWLTEFKMKEILHLINKDTLERNRKLIHLDNIPKWVNKNIAKAFKKAEVPDYVDHSEYGAPDLKILITRQSALFQSGDTKGADKLDSKIESASKPKDPEDMSKKELIADNKRLQKDSTELSWINNPDRMGK